jgi:D-alanine-D-alanine ligase
MRIAVVFGGSSAEREVSIASAAQIVPALRERGHEVFAVDTVCGRLTRGDEDRLLSRCVPSTPPGHAMAGARAENTKAVAISPEALAIRDVDVVFLALHGGAGEDGRIQSLLDLAGVAYTGSNHAASAVAMDKELSKRLFRSAGVPTPDWLMSPQTSRDIQWALGWPVVVKPNKQGSTVGLSVVRESSQLNVAVERAQQFDDEVMIETYIAGREFTVGIVEGIALPVGEIICPGEVFDYQAKYQQGVAREVFPAQISAMESTLMQEYARRAHLVLKLGAYSRIDFRRDSNGGVWCLEANSLPGMTATSLLPQAAAAAGMVFPDLLERICRGALQRREPPIGEAPSADAATLSL